MEFLKIFHYVFFEKVFEQFAEVFFNLSFIRLPLKMPSKKQNATERLQNRQKLLFCSKTTFLPKKWKVPFSTSAPAKKKQNADVYRACIARNLFYKLDERVVLFAAQHVEIENFSLVATPTHSLTTFSTIDFGAYCSVHVLSFLQSPLKHYKHYFFNFHGWFLPNEISYKYNAQSHQISSFTIDFSPSQAGWNIFFIYFKG